MSNYPLRFIAIALITLLPLKPAQAVTIELAADAQQRIGLRVSILQTVSAARTLAGVARVLDPLSLIRLDGDLRGAAAAAAASAAELQRLSSLQRADGNVSLKALQAAQAQNAADAAREAALRAELRTSWGGAMAAATETQRAAQLPTLAGGESVLVRVELLATPNIAFAPRVALLLPTGQAPVRAEILSTLNNAGESGVGPGWLARARSSSLVPGMAVPAQLETADKTSGVRLPRAAIVRWNGLSWVYVAIDARHFERRAVTSAEPLADGWLVSEGLQAGESVVVQSAAMLLSLETLKPEAEAE